MAREKPVRKARKNPHIGSSFESWLDAEGIRAEVTAAAVKAVISRQLAAEMQKKKITKQRMAELMKTSRAQVDRLLDPDNGSATIESLQRAARIVGRDLRMQLVRNEDGDASNPGHPRTRIFLSASLSVPTSIRRKISCS